MRVDTDKPLYLYMMDHGLIENWKAYYPTAIEVEDLCMVRGEKEPLATFHPAKLRHAGERGDGTERWVTGGRLAAAECA